MTKGDARFTPAQHLAKIQGMADENMLVPDALAAKLETIMDNPVQKNTPTGSRTR